MNSAIAEQRRPSKNIWRECKIAVVVLFVVWHLFFLLLRNPLDLWGSEIQSTLENRLPAGLPVYRWIDRATWRYANFLGLEQGWDMFTPPLARGASYLAARLEFTDGTDLLFLSENEPDPKSYLRMSGWRQRKLEAILLRAKPSELSQSEDLPVFEAYARWTIQRWQEGSPDDMRTPKQVVLLRRRIAFPGPDQNPAEFEEAEVSLIGTFSPEGKLR
jgi:hypothetical protein